MRSHYVPQFLLRSFSFSSGSKNIQRCWVHSKDNNFCSNIKNVAVANGLYEGDDSEIETLLSKFESEVAEELRSIVLDSPRECNFELLRRFFAVQTIRNRLHTIHLSWGMGRILDFFSGPRIGELLERHLIALIMTDYDQFLDSICSASLPSSARVRLFVAKFEPEERLNLIDNILAMDLPRKSPQTASIIKPLFSAIDIPKLMKSAQFEAIQQIISGRKDVPFNPTQVTIVTDDKNGFFQSNQAIIAFGGRMQVGTIFSLGKEATAIALPLSPNTCLIARSNTSTHQLTSRLIRYYLATISTEIYYPSRVQDDEIINALGQASYLEDPDQVINDFLKNGLYMPLLRNLTPF